MQQGRGGSPPTAGDAARGLVRSAARLLLLPPTATATALAFVHGWEDACAQDEHAAALPPLPPPRLAGAALFLAAKASPDTSGGGGVRTNDLVNAVAFCCWEAAGAGGGGGGGGGDGGGGGQGCDDGDGHAAAPPRDRPPFQAVAGARYAAAKATLLADEALLLRGLRFRVAPCADAPLKAALNGVRVLGRSSRVARGAAALCADALAGSGLPRSTGPGTIAAAAVLVSSLAAGEEDAEEGGATRRPDGSQVWWWEALGADTAGVLAAAEDMVGLVERGA